MTDDAFKVRRHAIDIDEVDTANRVPLVLLQLSEKARKKHKQKAKSRVANNNLTTSSTHGGARRSRQLSSSDLAKEAILAFYLTHQKNKSLASSSPSGHRNSSRGVKSSLFHFDEPLVSIDYQEFTAANYREK